MTPAVEARALVKRYRDQESEVEALADVDHAGDDAIGMSVDEEPCPDLEGHGAPVLSDANHWTP